MAAGVEPVRLTAIFRGMVQGVGFRFTAVRLADKFSLSGYVQNLRNGTVEVSAEGARPELERFLAAIQSAMAGYIRGSSEQWSPASGEYRNFIVRF